MSGRILVDMDDTICDWMGAATVKMQSLGYDVATDPRAYPVSVVLSEDYGLRAISLLHQVIREPGFFRDLRPHKPAIEMIRKLEAAGFDVWICTMPLPYDKEDWCKEEKKTWVARHLGHKYVKKIIFSSRKYEVPGAYLIDDSPAIIDYAKNQNPTWKPVLVNHLYNESLHCERRVSIATMDQDMLEILQRDNETVLTLISSISEVMFGAVETNSE